MPPVTCPTESVPVAYAPGWVPVALTSRGVAAARLSDFQDGWAELLVQDRAWFTETLAELLADACRDLTG